MNAFVGSLKCERDDCPGIEIRADQTHVACTQDGCDKSISTGTALRDRQRLTTERATRTTER